MPALEGPPLDGVPYTIYLTASPVGSNDDYYQMKRIY
jgi:hypothetical protein